MLVICILIKGHTVDCKRFHSHYVWYSYMLINKTEWFLVMQLLCNEWSVYLPPTLTSPTYLRFQGRMHNSELLGSTVGWHLLLPLSLIYFDHVFPINLSIVLFPPLCNCRDIVMVRIRRIRQSIVESFPDCPVLLLPQHLSGELAACRSLDSQQPSCEHLC